MIKDIFGMVQLRRQLKLTQSEFAEAIGVKRGTLHKWERTQNMLPKWAQNSINFVFSQNPAPRYLMMNISGQVCEVDLERVRALPHRVLYHDKAANLYIVLQELLANVIGREVSIDDFMKAGAAK